MKLKRLADDFLVEEIPTIPCGDRGPYTFYRLTKRGLGTLEALEAIRRRWNLANAQVHYGGLKDRHAVTIQYLTILEGPNRPLYEQNLELEPIGRLPMPYGPACFRGNRFEVVLRDMSVEAAAKAVRAARELPRDGLPNYFDDQRFGSVGPTGEFIGGAWLKGDHERALYLAIAEHNHMDRPDVSDEKTILREHWNDWPAAKAKLDKSHARSLVTYLVDHPTDYRGAFARLRRDLRSIYFSAYQSHLWNLLLARLITNLTREDQRVMIDFKVCPMPLHRHLDAVQSATLNAWRVPLPASRTPLPEGPNRELALEVMAGVGVTWEEIRVKHLKDVFFSKGDRAALFHPTEMIHRPPMTDDLYPGRRKIELSFELPKGAYATMVVKRLTEAS